LRKIERAENEYKSKNGRYGTLRELSDTGLISGSLAKGVGDGYRYKIRLKGDSYQAHALPDKTVDHNLPAFLIDESGVMHMSPLEVTEATVNDPSPSEK
jgi:ribosomal protein L6P/L9E